VLPTFSASCLAAEANFGCGCAALRLRLQLDWPCPYRRSNPSGIEGDPESPALELHKDGAPADRVS